MSDRIKNILIAIFVLFALGIIIFILLFLHPYLGDEGQIIKVRFTNIDKVNVGTRVTFAGKPVGEVTAIHELEETRKSRKAFKGDIYVYELDLAVDSSLKIYNSDKIFLKTSGLLGERSVAIDPEPLKPGQQLRLVNREILYAETTGSVEETFQEFKEVADRFDLVLDMLKDALNELKERKAWKNIAKTVENLTKISQTFVDKEKTIQETIDEVRLASGNIREITEKIQKGKGTLGKLIAQNELYLRLTSLLSKGETIFDDVNHYGLLFHLDKGWQRLRARRMNLLEKLSSPQEFRNYFNDEIDQILTSLSRVSMILEKTRGCPLIYPSPIDNCEFVKVFAELLRRVQSLEEALKMYNIQMVEEKVQETELTRTK